jgi:hypothetical protein
MFSLRVEEEEAGEARRWATGWASTDLSCFRTLASDTSSGSTPNPISDPSEVNVFRWIQSYGGR